MLLAGFMFFFSFGAFNVLRYILKMVVLIWKVSSCIDSLCLAFHASLTYKDNLKNM